MRDLPKDMEVNCERFLEELEGLPPVGPKGCAVEDFLARMGEGARWHRERCTNCQAAMQDFLETRQALQGIKWQLPEVGPWFSKRVMAAIVAKEAEYEEKKEGVWVSVRRLAPRMVAIAAVVLVVGGSWAIELRRADQASGAAVRAAESLFEGALSQPVSDEIVASANEEQVP